MKKRRTMISLAVVCLLARSHSPLRAVEPPVNR